MERGEGLARVEDDDDEIEEIMLDAPCDVFEVDLYSVDVDVLLQQHAEAEEKFKEDHERLKENRRTSRQAADYGHDAAKPAPPGSASESPRRAATPPPSSKISALREKFRAQRSAASPSAPTQAAHALTPEPSSPPRRPGESPPPPQFGAADQPRRRESGGSRGHDTAGADMSGAMADPEEDARAMADVNAPGMSDDDALIAAAAAMMDGGRVQDSPSAHRDGRDEGSGDFRGAAAAGIGKDGRAVKPRFTGIGANSRRCPVVCEILDGRTQRTIAGNPSLRGAADWMQSNQMVSQILAMVAEDRDVKCVLDELLGLFRHKQAKVVAASVQMFTQLLQEFGVQHSHCPTKDVTKAVPKLLDNSDANVRTEVMSLAVELCRWCGNGPKALIEKHLEGKSSGAMLAEFKSRTDEMAPPSALRVLKGSAASSGTSMAAAAPVDVADLAEPVDVLAKLEAKKDTKNWADAVLKKEKWQEKKDMLDALITLADTPRIGGSGGEYSDVVKSLKKLLGDSMVVVVSLAAKALGLLARGMRKEFVQHAKQMCAPLIDKLGDKDKRVLIAVHDALDNIAQHCLSPAEAFDEVATVAAGKKAPKKSIEAMQWAQRCVARSTAAMLQKGCRTLMGAALTFVDDPDEKVREGAYVLAGDIIGVVGEGDKCIRDLLDSLDGRKKARLLGGKCDSDALSKSTAVPTTRATRSTESSRDGGLDGKAMRVGMSRPRSASVAPLAKKPRAAAGKTGGAHEEDEAEEAALEMSEDELRQIVADFVAEETQTALGSAKWSERADALDAMRAAVEARNGLEPAQTEALLVRHEQTHMHASVRSCTHAYIADGARTCMEGDQLQREQ